MCAQNPNCLPIEIWDIITKTLNSSHDLNNLAKTNRCLFEMTNRILYRKFAKEAMMLGAQTGQVNTVKLCLEHCPELEVAILVSALTKAASVGHLLVITVLWESSPGMNLRRAIKAACQHGNIEVLRYFFDRQTVPSLRYMFTVAHRVGHTDTVTFIMETALARGKIMFPARSINCPDSRLAQLPCLGLCQSG